MQIILGKEGRKGLGLLVIQSPLILGHKSLQKNDQTYRMFIEDLVFYICKGYWVFSTTKNIWLKRLVLHQCPWVS
jgi:hypothetical protein